MTTNYVMHLYVPLPHRSMRTVGAIAFWVQFQARINSAFEIRFGLRRERWGVGDWGGGDGWRGD